MKISIALLGAAAITLGTTIAVQAGGVRGAGPAHARGGAGSRPASTQHSAEEAAEVAALKPAFTLLLGADHDYDGHRVKAMVAIAEACRMMGTDIVPPDLKERLERAGEGHAATTHASTGGATTKVAGVKHATSEPETQTASDGQLKQALTIVQQVHDGIGAGKQPRIVAKLADAISDINQALAVK